MTKPIVLYDETCYLCRQSKKIVKKIDWLHIFNWESLQTYEKNYPLTKEKKQAIKEELHVITPKRQQKVGYQSIRYILLRCPPTFLLGLLLYIPKSHVIGDPIYRWVAKNRYRLFKDKCENGACNIHK